MEKKVTKQDCQNLVDMINQNFFNGIRWFHISDTSVALKDYTNSTLFLERSFRSLYCDILAFYMGLSFNGFPQTAPERGE
ncbi:MAG: hypothetical protein J6S67_19030 [Methanobrevibacter sp.]|nr:hypothetical protein [Methanobrevibacter sp.]